MPLNNHPSAKPTYDFYDTVPLGKTAIANGELVSQLVNLPDANFPGGSTTWHWHSPEGIASYLVENSIGSYDLSERLASSGIQYYEAQDLAIPKNRAAGEQGDHGHAGRRPQLPERLQRHRTRSRRTGS